MNQPEWIPQHVTNSTDNHFYISENESPWSSYILMFWSSMNIPFLWHIRQGSHNFLQNLLPSFQSSCGIPPNLNQNVMQTHCSCNSTVHNSTLLSNHTCYSPTSNTKWLSRLYLLNPSSRCVTSRSVHESFDHPMYLPEHKLRTWS